MQKFLVVSYDSDQSDWFWDFVVAENEEEAVGLVCDARPYVISADAATGPQLDTMSRALYQTSAAQIDYHFHELTETMFKCQNCGKHWKEEDLHGVEDFLQRVAPGEEIPAGQCPDADCGAVCHKIERPKPARARAK